MNLREIQKTLGCTADGIFGPRTAAALKKANYRVVIDPGHTADTAREHPSAWGKEYWEQEPGRTVAEHLGIRSDTGDSVEHILNSQLAAKISEYLEEENVKTLVYDSPTLGNKEEYILAARVAEAAAPVIFLSLHANASCGVSHSATNTAWGSIVFYRKNCTPSLRLAGSMADAFQEVRTQAAAPGNRANDTAPGSSYYVLSHVPHASAAVLCEVGFYDHARDLLFMATYQYAIAYAMAHALAQFIRADT